MASGFRSLLNSLERADSRASCGSVPSPHWIQACLEVALIVRSASKVLVHSHGYLVITIAHRRIDDKKENMDSAEAHSLWN